MSDLTVLSKSSDFEEVEGGLGVVIRVQDTMHLSTSFGVMLIRRLVSLLFRFTNKADSIDGWL